MGGIVKFGDWISEGWDLFRREWRTWALMGVLFFVPPVLIVVAFVVPIILMAQSKNGPDSQWLILMITCSFMALFLMGFYASMVMAGMYRAAFKQLEGHAISVHDLWSGTDVMWQVLIANGMIMILTLAGVLLCYFPALIVGGLAYFTIPLIVRKKLTAMEGISHSFEVTKKDWIMFTLFAFVVGLIAQVGAYACYVGIVFSLPLTFTIGAVAYRDCFEPELRAPPPVDELYTKNCRVCRASIPDRAVFCDQCGAGQV